MNPNRIARLLAAMLPLAGPVAAAPATVETTLTGRTVKADIYKPTEPPVGAVVLVHGFLRSRINMAGHAAALADEGYLAIAPEMPYVTDSRDNAVALVELIAQVRAGAFAPAAERIVLVGFSAGGLSTLLAAASPGVVGYVGLDAIDRPGGVGLAAARTLRTPAMLIRAPSSFCNGYGIAEPWSGVLPALRSRRLIEGASHCDFEAPTDRRCEAICGATDPVRRQIIRDALLDSVRRLMPHDHATPSGGVEK